MTSTTSPFYLTKSVHFERIPYLCVDFVITSDRQRTVSDYVYFNVNNISGEQKLNILFHTPSKHCNLNKNYKQLLFSC